MKEVQQWRIEIEQALADGAHLRALEQLRRLWSHHASPSIAAYILGLRGKHPEAFAATKCRLAILRSFTLEPAIPILRASALLRGLDIDVHVGGFNAYAQDIYSGSSALYTFAPDVVLLCVQTRDIAPQIWDQFPDLKETEVSAAVDGVVEQFRSMFAEFRQKSRAHLIVHSFELPTVAAAGILDGQIRPSQSDAVRRMNDGIRSAAAAVPGSYILDYEALVARHGKQLWFHASKWLTVRMPIAPQFLPHLAGEWLRFLQPLCGAVCKVLVTDLDNTLWGGVAGEDGLGGIKLGNEYPGAIYTGIQRALLDLHRRGVILAIASKNNEADALRILEEHPNMLLRPKHFAVTRISWQDKASSVREIAADLNLGLDSVALLDDNPVERSLVREQLPDVKVIDLPDSAMEFERAIRDCPFFERLAITDEDRDRSRHYREQRERTMLASSATSLEEFYVSLRQSVEICEVRPETVARVAQLTQKTNQFNLTTRRYNEQEIREFMVDPSVTVYSVSVKDRFGDNGIVGVLMTRDRGPACEIDTLLLSCRVIGRTIETAILSFLCEQCRTRSVFSLQGCFIPSKKNAPAADVYANHQFEQLLSDGERTLWRLDLTKHTIDCPAWIEMQIPSDRAMTKYAG